MNKIFLLTYVFYLFSNQAYCSYGIYYMDDLCNKEVSNIALSEPTTEYDSTVVIRASKHLDYPRGVSCSVTILPPVNSSFGLVVSIEYLGLRLKRYSAIECMDRISLSNDDRKIYEGCRGSGVVFNNTGYMVLGMITTKDRDPVKRGFDITFTVYFEGGKYCQNDRLFNCANGQCIAKAVTCDGRSNCPDNSDEFMYGTSDCKTKRNRIALILGVIFGLSFLGGITYLAAARLLTNKRRRRLISPGVIEGSPYVTPTYKTLP